MLQVGTKIYDSEIWNLQNKEIESPMKNETLTSSDLKIDGQNLNHNWLMP